MSFPAAHAGILTAEELAVIRNVYQRIICEPWVSRDPVAQEQFARYVLKIYGRGMCEPEKLFRLCLVAAKHKLSDSPLSGSSGRTGPSQ